MELNLRKRIDTYVTNVNIILRHSCAILDSCHRR